MNDRSSTSLGSRRHLRAEVLGRVREGWALEAVERDVIAPAPLDADGRDGLWLYAWSAGAVGADGAARRRA